MSWELLAHEDVVKNIDKLRKLCIARKETMGKIKGVLKKKRVFSGL